MSHCDSLDPPPAALQCPLCLQLLHRAVRSSCDNCTACRGCAIKHVTQHRLLWSTLAMTLLRNNPWFANKNYFFEQNLVLPQLNMTAFKGKNHFLIISTMYTSMFKRQIFFLPLWNKVDTMNRKCWNCEMVILKTSELTNDDITRNLIWTVSLLNC